MQIDLEQLRASLEEKLVKSLMLSRILVGKARMIDEQSRLTSAYTDPHYLPFYYYLGSLIEPQNVVEIGFRLGLLGSCLMQGCKTIQTYLAAQEPTESFYSPRLGRANVKDHFKGELIIHTGLITDNYFIDTLDSRLWDLAIVNEEVGYDKHMAYLDMLWERMSVDGLIVVDYLTRHKPASQSFFDFVKVRNRKPVLLNTRYGVGIIQR